MQVLFVSQKLIDKSSEYKRIKPWLQEGLLLSTGTGYHIYKCITYLFYICYKYSRTGKKWFQRRKILTPAFHFKILEQFIEVFDKQGKVLVEVLRKFKETDKIDLYSLVKLYTLDVICGKKYI